MADFTKEAGVGSSPSIKTTPDNYTALDDFLLASNDAINKPDVRELLIKTYGDQGITGFLTLTGAVKNAGAADQVEYFEEQRRHTRITSGATGSTIPATGKAVVLGSTAVSQLQDYDVILDVTSGDRFLVKSPSGNTATLYALNTTSGVITKDADQALIGNMYPQGANQPTKFRDPGVERRQNPFMIVKERFQVTGSQATNIGYINTGNGDYRWFMYGEQEARKRFLDKREMMMLFAGQVNGLAGTGSTGLAGSEGYFTAVESRGNVWAGGLGATGFASDIDEIIAQLDKQGAPAEYAMYVNRELDLQIDDKLAAGISSAVTAGLPGQFGAFNNSPDMAVQLGFKSFTRGGYTFHKHDWKLLNDPTLLAGSKFTGAMVPMTKVADPRTGAKSYALEMNYKSTNGYDRELNHWVTGGAVLGYTNNGDEGKDVATFHYRSECNLVTRAANQHVIFTS
jgi:hypothetical protein